MRGKFFNFRLETIESVIVYPSWSIDIAILRVAILYMITEYLALQYDSYGLVSWGPTSSYWSTQKYH